MSPFTDNLEIVVLLVQRILYSKLDASQRIA